MTEKPVYFFSDAHLGIMHPTLVSRPDQVIRFLRDIRLEASHLFIGGDFFDFWMEYPLLVRRDYFPVLCELRALTEAGVVVHYIRGNHDFAVGDFFEKELGITVHDHAYKGVLQGKTVHVLHGDGFVKADLGYRFLKFILRNQISHFLYRLIHPSIAIPLAERVSQWSRTHSGNCISPEKEAIYRDRAQKYLADTGADILVLGHTHRASLYEFSGAIYCNTGEWLEHPSFARMCNGALTLWQSNEAGGYVRRMPVISAD